jgi:arylsulfatase A-like enzyme
LDLRLNASADWSQGGVYSTFLYTAAVVRDIHAHAAAAHADPMFAYIAYQAVHGPLEAPAEAIALFPEISDRKRQTYAAMLYLLDEGVGNISCV